MLKIAIIDTVGLAYDGNTLNSRGLGGSESAVILISKELVKIGFKVDVYNNCIDSQAKPGVYEGVRFIDHTMQDSYEKEYDVVISSRSVFPFFPGSIYRFIEKSKWRVLWMHDTFCKGDENLEEMVVKGVINEVFTLSDFHTNYTFNNEHGNKRMFDVLKHKNFLTRNGAVKYLDEVDLSKKDPNHFVYNASVTKGLKPLLLYIWPDVKRLIPNAHLTVIGGYYRFRDGSAPDEQEKDLIKFKEIYEGNQNFNVKFTGVIKQQEIANILANATYMIYPTDFPETFGISSLESLLYKTPLITCRFGALEETAIDLACYKLDYPLVPNSVYPHINLTDQADKFIKMTYAAYNTPYLLQQKQNYCDVVNDIYSWATIALQWKQHLYMRLGLFLSADEFRAVSRINDKVARVYGRRFNNEVDRRRYSSTGKQKKISVITPFYNAENYIQKCILSITSQEYENYELILIDDASTDNSYNKAKDAISSLHPEIQIKCRLIKNDTNMGAVYNHYRALSNIDDDSIVMLVDGDDSLHNNNTIFHLYNDLYQQGAEFTYGSCWSMIDNIPLVAQDYPKEVKEKKLYRKHKFAWNMPYTHLRTFTKKLFKSVSEDRFKDNAGNWLRAGGDGALFYEMIERADPNKVIAVKEIVYYYNDTNPLNDYKVNAEQQTKNAQIILNK